MVDALFLKAVCGRLRLIKLKIKYGPVAKLVDALDLGSSAFGVRVRVSPGPILRLLSGVFFVI